MALKFVADKVLELVNVVEEIKERRGDLNYYTVKCFPWPMFVVFVSYLTFTKLGPKWMANRKPFELKSVMVLYNLLQVVLNVWLGIYGFYHVFAVRKTSLFCEPMDYSRSQATLMEYRLGVYYMLLKILDLLDTVFIILKKNERQLSTLHIYHHSGMIVCGFAGFFFVPNGTSAWLPIVNVVVHAIMYSYYLLTTLNPAYKKNLWMKKSLTQIQMIQFIFLTIIFTTVAIRSDCEYPKIPAGIFTIQCSTMFAMFYDFYRRNYTKKNASS